MNTGVPRNPFRIVRIDLIYEGIATKGSWLDNSKLDTHSPNWPDLRRDCDTHHLAELFKHIIAVRIDLIYEGIATKSTTGWSGNDKR